MTRPSASHRGVTDDSQDPHTRLGQITLHKMEVDHPEEGLSAYCYRMSKSGGSGELHVL